MQILPFEHLTARELRHHIANFEADRAAWDNDDAQTFRQLLEALVAKEAGSVRQPNLELPPAGAEKFWSQVDTSVNCWLWKAGRDGGGYGRFKILGVSRLAHRVAFTMATGPIPAGLNVCHRCDVPACVRPDHLFLGSQLDNMRDCSAKGRTVGSHGTLSGMAKLTDATALEILEKYATTTVSKSQLARDYGISESSIRKLIRRDTWRHLPVDEQTYRELRAALSVAEARESLKEVAA
jgi:transposase-like protein